jgi:hypothetical protein
MAKKINDYSKTFPIGLNDQGEPWTEDTLPWYLDEKGILHMKPQKVETNAPANPKQPDRTHQADADQ